MDSEKASWDEELRRPGPREQPAWRHSSNMGKQRGKSGKAAEILGAQGAWVRREAESFWPGLGEERGAPGG